LGILGFIREYTDIKTVPIVHDNFFYLKKFAKLNSTRQNVLKKYNIHWTKYRTSYLTHEHKLHSGNDWNEGVRDTTNEAVRDTTNELGF